MVTGAKQRGDQRISITGTGKAGDRDDTSRSQEVRGRISGGFDSQAQPFRLFPRDRGTKPPRGTDLHHGGHRRVNTPAGFTPKNVAGLLPEPVPGNHNAGLRSPAEGS